MGTLSYRLYPVDADLPYRVDVVIQPEGNNLGSVRFVVYDGDDRVVQYTLSVTDLAAGVSATGSVVPPAWDFPDAADLREDAPWATIGRKYILKEKAMLDPTRDHFRFGGFRRLVTYLVQSVMQDPDSAPASGTYAIRANARITHHAPGTDRLFMGAELLPRT